MSEPDKGSLTRALNSLGRSLPEPPADVFPTVYHELKRLAHGQLAREKRSPEFQTTMVVNEAYVRLMGGKGAPTWENRAHFYGAAARAMRQILVDAARKRKARDRHRLLVRPPEAGALGDGAPGEPLDLLALEDALAELERLDPALGHVVSLRFFAGLSMDQAADALGVSPRTVKRQWSFARAWLYRRMTGSGTGDESSDR